MHGSEAGRVADSQRHCSCFTPELRLLSIWSFTWILPMGFLPPLQNKLVGAIGCDTLPLYANAHLMYPGYIPLGYLMPRVRGKVLQLNQALPRKKQLIKVNLKKKTVHFFLAQYSFHVWPRQVQH